MIHVTCAIIEHEGKVLICQRSARMKLPLKWEFPGGKIEPRESKEECLAREIQEELGISIQIGQPMTAVEHQDKGFSLTLYPFLCTLTGGHLHPTEHAEAIWVNRSELMNYDWAAADVPVVNEYLARWK